MEEFSSCSQVMKLRINGSGLQGDIGDAVSPSSSILHQESKQLQSVDATQRGIRQLNDEI